MAHQLLLCELRCGCQSQSQLLLSCRQGLLCTLDLHDRLKNETGSVDKEGEQRFGVCTQDILHICDTLFGLKRLARLDAATTLTRADPLDLLLSATALTLSP